MDEQTNAIPDEMPQPGPDEMPQPGPDEMPQPGPDETNEVPETRLDEAADPRPDEAPELEPTEPSGSPSEVVPETAEAPVTDAPLNVDPRSMADAPEPSAPGEGIEIPDEGAQEATPETIAEDRPDRRSRRSAHAHDPYALRVNHAVFMVIYGLLGAGTLLYGLYRLNAQPERRWEYVAEYRWDFVIIIVVAAIFLGLAARRWIEWKALEGAVPLRTEPPAVENEEVVVGEAGVADVMEPGVDAGAGEVLPAAGDTAGAEATPPASSLAIPAAAAGETELPRVAPEPAPPPLYGRREAVLASVLMAAGLLLALFGQGQLDATHAGSLVIGLVFLVAGGLWLVALLRAPERVADGATPVLPGPHMDTQRLNALILGLFLVVFTAFVAPKVPVAGDVFGLLYYPIDHPGEPGIGVPVHPDSGTLTLFGGGMYLVGVLLVAWALADWGRVRSRWRAMWDGDALHFRLSRTALAVLAITVLGAWFRFHDLATLPYEMTSDHTEKLVDVRTIVAGLRPVFMPANSGREPMQFYWTALLVALGLPLSFMTLKIGMSIISTLTIPVIYRFGREVGDREIGLMAALIFAMAPWHIQITRIALRIDFAPLWVAIALIFLYKALASGRRNDWLLTGAALGLGMYGYSAFRPMVIAMPLVVLLKLVHDAFHRRRAGEPAALLSRPLAGHLAGAGAMAFLFVVPLLRYAIDQPGAIAERTLTRMTQAETTFENPIVLQFFINVKNALLMVNLTEDTAWFQSPPARPAMETVGGALFVLGLVVVLHRVWRRDWRLGTMTVIIPVMLLSSIMALAFPRENPSLSRASAALPMVVVLAALPLPVLAARWRAAWGTMGTAAYSLLLVALFLWMGRETSLRYFGEYRASYDNSTLPTAEAADQIRAFVTQGGRLDHAYYVSYAYGMDYRAIAMNLGDPDWGNIIQGSNPDLSDAAEGARAHVDDPLPKLYVVGGELAPRHIETLKSIFPDATVRHHPSTHLPGKEFWTVYVPEHAATPTPAATAASTMTPPLTPAATEQTP